MPINKSLLETVTSSEVNDLIIEEELIKEGFNLKYFIDQVDIEKYIFPFGLIEGDKLDNREQRPVEVITDEQIAYDYLLNIKKEKLLLFDEHIDEIEGLIRKIRKVKSYGITMVNSFQMQSDYFLKVREGRRITFEEWTNNQQLTSELNVSLLISIALGSLSSGIEKLNEIQGNKTIGKLDDYKQMALKTNESVFINCKPNDITNKLFDALYLSYSEPPQRRLARYKKCKVFNRLICINQESIKSKEIFLLLSSTKSLNERLPSIAKKLNYTVSIRGIEINPIRTIGQVYLKLLLRDKNKIEELKKIKDIIKLRDESNSEPQIEIINLAINKYFENDLRKMREEYENASLLLKIANYKELFQKALNNQQIKNNRIIAESILELIKIGASTAELEKLKQTNLISIEYKRNYQQQLNAALDEVSLNNKYLYAFSGSDYISNPYHTIPLVFYKGSEDFHKILENIVDLITDTSKNVINSRMLINTITQSFDLLFEKALPNEEELIIMLIILMMLGRTNENNPDLLAYDWINEFIKLGKYDKNWEIDLLYIKSWICRRLEKYDDAISLIEKPSLNLKEARLLHSLYLSYYCKFRESSEIEFLKKSLFYCELTYKSYSENRHHNKVISKIISTNLNSLAYLNILYYTNSSDQSYSNIISARNYLIDLKVREKSIFNKFPEFLHTEAMLEVQEYKKENKKSKLIYAQITIERAIKLNPKEEYEFFNEQIRRLLETS